MAVIVELSTCKEPEESQKISIRQEALDQRLKEIEERVDVFNFKTTPTDLKLLLAVVRELKTTVEYYANGNCHGCASEYGAPESVFDLPDTSQPDVARETLARVEALVGE